MIHDWNWTIKIRFFLVNINWTGWVPNCHFCLIVQCTFPIFTLLILYILTNLLFPKQSTLPCLHMKCVYVYYLGGHTYKKNVQYLSFWVLIILFNMNILKLTIFLQISKFSSLVHSHCICFLFSLSIHVLIVMWT